MTGLKRITENWPLRLIITSLKLTTLVPFKRANPRSNQHLLTLLVSGIDVLLVDYIIDTTQAANHQILKIGSKFGK